MAFILDESANIAKKFKIIIKFVAIYTIEEC